jgi:mannose-6-phosphate isomerase
MLDLYPLLLRPQFQERVWGSRDLSPFYPPALSGQPVGEAWLTGEECRVANGPLAGRTLAEVSHEFAPQLLGPTLQSSRFPLLVKFLFPRERLSVQVHPDDEMAAQAGAPCGKTECWYVLQAETGAKIALGLKYGIGKADVEHAIHETRMEELLNWIEVRSGEMYYVDAGTVHAIGPGSVIVETQQNSDTTYRLYDYGRPRELHVSEGLRALKEQTRAGRVAAGKMESANGKMQANLITSPFFIVDKFRLTQPWQFQRPGHGQRAVWCLVATSGCGVVESAGAPPIIFTAGETVIVPAGMDRFILRPQWDVEFLCSSLPTEPVPHPVTVPFENAVGKAK